jgi:hypothetical protein
VPEKPAAPLVRGQLEPALQKLVARLLEAPVERSVQLQEQRE